MNERNGNRNRAQANHYHLVGVAGVGMSALAQGLIHAGHMVTGSDRSHGLVENATIMNKLERAGVRLFAQDGSGITSSITSVVVSTAIECDNPDIIEARSVNVPVRHRSEVLAELVRERTCIAVTGTAGKSTVTGMIGWILETSGHDPWVMTGGPVLNWVDEYRIGNFRGGMSDICVIEADESDRSLLQFAPDWGVITNMSRDHFEIKETQRLFDTFRGQCITGTVSAVHEPELLQDMHVETTVAGVRFVYRDEAYEMSLPGKHNSENGALAAELCLRMRVDSRQIHLGLASFQGIERRLQKVGEARGICVFDDYAHNPAKIRAAWETLAEKHSRIIAVWRPHGFGPLAMMLDDLSETLTSLFRENDRIYLLPVYDAGGTADRSINSAALVERLPAHCASLAESAGELPMHVAGEVADGDAILVMGARDSKLSLLAERILEEVAVPARRA